MAASSPRRCCPWWPTRPVAPARPCACSTSRRFRKPSWRPTVTSSPIPTRRCHASRARRWTTSPHRSCGSAAWRPSARCDSATPSMRFFARSKPSTPTRSCSPPGITVASAVCCSEAPRSRSVVACRCPWSSSGRRLPADHDHRNPLREHRSVGKGRGAGKAYEARGGTTMLVSDVMQVSLVTAAPRTTLSAAVRLMTDRRVRHLPVMDAGRLVGIVSDRDVKRVMASPATSLAANELNYLLDKLTVGQFMTRELNYLLDKLTVEQFMTRAVITVTPTLPIEEAARIMLKERISALPVTEGERVVGIVTETDVMELVVRALGAGEPSSRRDV